MISWLGWVPQALHARQLFPFNTAFFSFLGGVGPTLAAVILMLILGEKDGPRKLFGALFHAKGLWKWLGLVIGFWGAVTGLVLGGVKLLTPSMLPVNEFQWLSIFPIFITMLISNVWEEIGWRGFALPRLQKRYNDLVIVFMMGLLWELWHLPLYLNPDNPMSNLNMGLAILFSLAITVLYIWLYNNTQGSLFFVTVFHALSNTAAFILLELGIFESSYALVTVIISLTAVAILLKYGPQRFD